MSRLERFWHRANKTMGADLPPSVDVGLSLASLFLGLVISLTGIFNKPTSIIITTIGAMPILATYYVRTHRERSNKQGGRGFLLYLRELFWSLIGFAVLGGIGYLFVRFGGSGS